MNIITLIIVGVLGVVLGAYFARSGRSGVGASVQSKELDWRGREEYLKREKNIRNHKRC